MFPGAWLILQCAIHVGILQLEQREILRLPGPIRVIVKNHFFYVNYLIAQWLFKTSLAGKVMRLLVWCLRAAIFIVALPIVLLIQTLGTIPQTMQRVANQRTAMAKIKGLDAHREFSPKEDVAPNGPLEATGGDRPGVFSTYKYQPLASDDGIRLLELLPLNSEQEKHHGPLRGKITHVHLRDAPKYIALSYCWNDMDFISAEARSIDPIINLDLEGSLALTQSLFAGLRSALSRGYRVFWVDQICINQSDIIEKSRQVAMMKDIYSHASQVLVWLGNDTPGKKGEEALHFADHLSKCVEEKNLLGPQTDFFKQATIQTNDMGLPPVHTYLSQYVSLLMLLKRPWFIRSWIVQEVSLNSEKRVLCGSTEISFQSLSTALLICMKSVTFMTELVPKEVITAFKALTQSSEFTKGELEASPKRLLDVMIRHRGCRATLPSDKVFAFLNISNDHEALGIHADYNMCARTVYMKAAVAILKHHGNLDILSGAKAWSDGPIKGLELTEPPRPLKQPCLDETPACVNEGHPDHLPLWVPDWSVPNFTPSFRSRGEHGEYFGEYWAVGHSSPIVQFRRKETQLGLNGYLLDRIAEVGPVFSEDVYSRIGLHFSVLKSWEDICGAWDERVYAPTGESMFSAFCGTLTSGAEALNARSAKKDVTGASTHKPNESKSEWFGGKVPFTSQYRQLRIALRMNWFLSSLWPGMAAYPAIFNVLLTIGLLFNIGWENIAAFLGREATAGSVSPGLRYRIFASAHHRRFIRTENGFIGLASLHVREGDHVGLFSGGAVPLVIRRADQLVEEWESWEIVSDAYIHGVMFGEVFDMEKCHTLWFV